MNPYKLFCDDLEVDDTDISNVNLDNRLVFTTGKTNRRHYIIHYAKPQNWLWFNYAVSSAWAFPSVTPPSGPEDFPPNANSSMAYWMDAHEVMNSLWFNPLTEDGGGDIVVDFDLHHHPTGFDSFDEITVLHWDSGFFGPAFPAAKLYDVDIVGGGQHFTTFRLNLINVAKPKSLDDIQIMVVCKTEEGNRVSFQSAVSVTEKGQGLNLEKRIAIPGPLPITTEMDFSVRGDAGREGVYYIGGDLGTCYIIDVYPLDYSTGGTGWDYIDGPHSMPWEEPEYILGPSHYCGKLDISPSNSFLLTSHCPDGFYDLWPPIRKKSFINMWSDETGTVDSPHKLEIGTTPNPEYNDGSGTFGNFFPVDLDAGYGDTGDIVMALMIPDPLGPVASDVDWVAIAVSKPPYVYEYDGDRYLGLLSPGPTRGILQGLIDPEHSVAIAIDTDPDGNGAHLHSDTMFYVAENIPGSPDIEVLRLDYYSFSTSTGDGEVDYSVLGTITGLQGEEIVDISLLNSLDAGYSTEFNWVAALEKATGGGWLVELYDQNGTYIDSSGVFEGEPIHLDVDAINFRIHVWHTESGYDQTMMASVLYYEP